MADRDESDGFVVHTLKAGNRHLLNWAFDRPRLLLGVAAIGVAGAIFAAALLPRSFLPPFNEGTLNINIVYSPGISLAESNRLGLAAERLLLGVPEVKSVGRRTGRAELDEHAEGVHSSEIDVYLHPAQRSKEALLTDIRGRLSALPAAINVGQPISHRLDHLLSGIRAEIALKIFGEDPDTLRTVAERFRQQLAGVPGLVDLQVEKQVRIPQLQVRVDPERAALHGSVAALWLAGQPLSVASMVGFITLAGISARNGILKISHYINLALHEGESFERALILRGSLDRLTPLLMTALGAGLALVPLVLGAGEPGTEILHPVAVTILGGLISSTLLDKLVAQLTAPLEKGAIVAVSLTGADDHITQARFTVD